MNSSSKDIANMLANESSLDLTLGTSLFPYIMPEIPQNVVTVFDNPGEGPMLTLSKTESRYYYPSVSVWVRNIDYNTGYGIMLAILQFLHGTSKVVVNSTYYALITAKNDPQLLHYDEINRPIFIVNFEIQRRENN